jgi:tetratricopeptide (TPR) repeat protein
LSTLSFNQLIDLGIIALNRGDTANALPMFQKAAETATPPVVLSCLGYCLAKELGEKKKGRGLCMEALRRDPQNALHYLNLGRTCLLNGQKSMALHVFRKGLGFDKHTGIIAELRKMGTRQQPVFSSLSRENPVNRCFGFLFHRLGLRRGKRESHSRNSDL